MKSEKRLLLAMGLTFLVLTLWSVVFPPPKSPSVEGLSGQEEAMEKGRRRPEGTLQKPTESLLEGEIGPLHLGVGEISGGIRTLGSHGVSLLTGSDPGLFQVEMINPVSPPLRFQSRWEGKVLTSEAALGTTQMKLVKEISSSKQMRDSLLECKLQVSNGSQQEQRLRLRFVAYRPVYIQDPKDRQYQYGAVSIGGKNYPLALKPGSSHLFQGAPGWIAAQGKSHALILQLVVPEGMFHVEHPLSGEPVGWLELPEARLAPGSQAEWDFHLYAGPMDLAHLKAAGLEEALHLGAFSGIGKILLELLIWLESWLHNYGLAIVFLSVGIWLLFFPMTWSGIRMMKVMGQLQPQMERIRKEYGKNPQKMNQEMLELYRKHRINPLSGCLPLLFQMPIFISLYQVLSRSPQLQGAGFLWIRDLSAPDALIHFPSPVPLLGGGLNALPILMAAAMFFQQQMTQRSQTAVTKEQQMQQQVFKWFPLLFGFMFYSLPSGLVLYWVSSTLLTLGQQLLLMRIL